MTIVHLSFFIVKAPERFLLKLNSKVEMYQEE